MSRWSWLGSSTPPSPSTSLLPQGTDKNSPKDSGDDNQQPLLTAQESLQNPESPDFGIAVSKTNKSRHKKKFKSLVKLRDGSSKDDDSIELVDAAGISSEIKRRREPETKELEMNENKRSPFCGRSKESNRSSIELPYEDTASGIESIADDRPSEPSVDPWGLHSSQNKSVDAKFTSCESEPSPILPRSSTGSKPESSTKFSPLTKQEKSGEYFLPAVLHNKLTSGKFHALSSKSSADSSGVPPIPKGPCATSARRASRLIHWQPIRGDGTFSSSASPPATSSDSDSSSSFKVVTPNHSPYSSRDNTAFHTPKHSFSNASETDVSNRDDESKLKTKHRKLKRTRSSKGDYTKLDTGSSEIIGTTECNTTATLITGTENTTTQNDYPVLDEAVPSSPEVECRKGLGSRVDSFLSTSSSGQDAYQRVSPGGTPWTVWYRRPTLHCLDVPPLIHTQENNTMERKRRLTEIPRLVPCLNVFF